MQDPVRLGHIVDGCIQAKRESQKTFYQMYYGFAMNICMRYCKSHDDAVETLNDGFLKVFRQLQMFTPRYQDYEASLMAWMKSIFVHTSIDHYRKEHRNQPLQEIREEHDQEEAPYEDALDRMTYKEIIRLVQQLSPVYRTIFNLYVIDGFKHEEIARQLNISVGASKSNLSKARANIQKMIREKDISLYERRAI